MSAENVISLTEAWKKRREEQNAIKNDQEDELIDGLIEDLIEKMDEKFLFDGESDTVTTRYESDDGSRFLLTIVKLE